MNFVLFVSTFLLCVLYCFGEDEIGLPSPVPDIDDGGMRMLMETTTERKGLRSLDSSFEFSTFVQTAGTLSAFVKFEREGKSTVVWAVNTASDLKISVLENSGWTTRNMGSIVMETSTKHMIIDSSKTYIYAATGCIIKKIDIANESSEIVAGSGCGTSDGPALSASFGGIHGLLLKDNIMYIAHYGASIRMWNMDTDLVSTLTGSQNFGNALHIADGGIDTVYVTDFNRVYSMDTNTLDVTLIAGSMHGGSVDGVGEAARFYYPWNACTFSTDVNNLYVGAYGSGLHHVTIGDRTSTKVGPPSIFSMHCDQETGDLFIGNYHTGTISVASVTTIDSTTNNPTTSPTKNPTSSPTKNPTTSPTKNPTTSPTTSPTKNPTASPTTSPTKNPTASPTTSPTKNPTISPTKNPTTSPTTSPTASPTTSPTINCGVITNPSQCKKRDGCVSVKDPWGNLGCFPIQVAQAWECSDFENPGLCNSAESRLKPDVVLQCKYDNKSKQCVPKGAPRAASGQAAEASSSQDDDSSIQTTTSIGIGSGVGMFLLAVAGVVVLKQRRKSISSPHGGLETATVVVTNPKYDS